MCASKIVTAQSRDDLTGTLYYAILCWPKLKHVCGLLVPSSSFHNMISCKDSDLIHAEVQCSVQQQVKLRHSKQSQAHVRLLHTAYNALPGSCLSHDQSCCTAKQSYDCSLPPHRLHTPRLLLLHVIAFVFSQSDTGMAVSARHAVGKVPQTTHAGSTYLFCNKAA